MKLTSFRRSPGLALLLALLHGCLYIFLIPPWQHYDEPSHFEHVWLRAQNLAPQTPDLSFRYKLVQSMIANHFYQGAQIPTLESIDAGERIYGLEYSQLDEPPLYYLWASLLVRFLQDRNPAVMLIAARFMSVSLLVVTVLAIWGITCEMTVSDSPLRFWVPLSAALLPSFIDLMTAVNNDVAAVAAFSLFLWGSVYFLRNCSILAFLGLVLTTLLCLGAKSTAYFAAPLALFVLLLGWIKGKAAKWIWLALLILGGLGTITFFTWDDAASWHRATSQLLSSRVQTTTAPLGNYALQLDASAPSTPSYLRPLQQPLPLPPLNTSLTFGVWMWAPNTTSPVETRTPILNTGSQSFFTSVTLDATPRFFAFSITLPTDTTRVWLSVAPQRSDLLVYYDGFVLAEGSFPLDASPTFDDVNGQTGIWGRKPFQNFIRNPSAESIWPALRPSIDTRLASFIPDNARVSTWLYGLFDWPYTQRYFVSTANNLLQTFWARFGWGHVPLIFPGFYVFLWGLTGLSVLGAGLGLFSHGSYWDKRLIFLSLTLVIVWGATILRGEIFIFTSNIFIPGARYAYPAIAPTLLAFTFGWQVWGAYLKKYIQLPLVLRISNFLPYLFFLALCGLSIISIVLYYAPQ